MSYLPKATVEKNIKIRVRKDRSGNEHTDYEAYFGTDPFTKTAIRKTRSSRKELEKDIKDFYLRYSHGGDVAVRLSSIQSLDAKNAIDELVKANIKLSLTEVVRAYIDGSMYSQESSNKITVGKAVKEYCTGKESSQSDKTKTFHVLGCWSENFGKDMPLSSVTAKKVLEYLQANLISRVKIDRKTGKKTVKNLKPKTYNSHLLYLNTFFNWCAKEERKYLPNNPIKSLKYREEPWEEPEYLKASDAEKIMRLVEDMKDTRPDMLAYEIVNLFCGSRDIEVRRMAEEGSPNKVNIEDETIRIANGKGFQLGRRPRAFQIPATALAWMKSFDFMSAIKRVDSKTKEDIFKLARKNGIQVFQNFGRHTFITYHVAAYGDPAKTQAIVGTSEKMRADNYCGLASKAEGEAFFRIMPRAIEDSKLKDLEY